MSVCLSYIDVENEWKSLGIGIENIILYLIITYRFPNFPLIWTPPFIRFSENFPPNLLFGPPRLLGTMGMNTLIICMCKKCTYWTQSSWSFHVVSLHPWWRWAAPQGPWWRAPHSHGQDHSESGWGMHAARSSSEKILLNKCGWNVKH